MKNDKTKRNDLTLEIKERIKEYLHQELSPEQIVVFAQKRIMCVSTESIYQHIWKDKREFVFKSTNNWERYRKERSKRL
jgi:IS30 family transposase